jgi:hypothetical protein
MIGSNRAEALFHYPKNDIKECRPQGMNGGSGFLRAQTLHLGLLDQQLPKLELLPPAAKSTSYNNGPTCMAKPRNGPDSPGLWHPSTRAELLSCHWAVEK